MKIYVDKNNDTHVMDGIGDFFIFRKDFEFLKNDTALIELKEALGLEEFTISIIDGPIEDSSCNPLVTADFLDRNGREVLGFYELR